jgi:nitronate monooxygenase
LPSSPSFAFSVQLAAALETGASAFSFTFGLLPSDAMQALKQKKIFVVGTATTVNEAIELEKSGVDAVVAQGSEAGGHRGTFQRDPNASLIGTISLGHKLWMRFAFLLSHQAGLWMAVASPLRWP